MNQNATAGKRPLREVIQLYDKYTHEGLPRREFLARLTRLAGGAAAASVILPLLENQYALAATVAADNPALVTNYAGLDTRINTAVPAFEQTLKTAGARYELFTYDGVDHAFHNDTNAARYKAEAAKLAWQRTVDFLTRQLG